MWQLEIGRYVDVPSETRIAQDPIRQLEAVGFVPMTHERAGAVREPEADPGRRAHDVGAVVMTVGNERDPGESGDAGEVVRKREVAVGDDDFDLRYARGTRHRIGMTDDGVRACRTPHRRDAVVFFLFLSAGILRVALWSIIGEKYFHRELYGPHWPLVAITVGLALVGVVLWGSLSGSMLPFVLRRVGADPATSSAPFVATLVDVTGLIIYFSIALVIMRGVML